MHSDTHKFFLKTLIQPILLFFKKISKLINNAFKLMNWWNKKIMHSLNH